MSNTQTFIETKEYKRFAEFCDACIKYQYMGICYGLPGVGKTLSAKQYARWDYLEKQINYEKVEFIDAHADEKILECHTLFYTAPPVSATKLTGAIHVIGARLNIVKDVYRARIGEKELNTSKAFKGINLIIVDEIDRLKLQHLEQLRDIYDQHDLAMVFIGMPGIEKRLARYPQLYSRIGFAHEYQKLSKDEMHHILEYKWDELGISIKREDFSDYEALTSIMKVTNGNFRLIHRLFTQIERILEINNLSSITTEVVEAARNSLVIGHN
ncbi:AAA family ATPase [Peribacillus castrilensis]|uniref:ATP-binding protein n=1 Tax=Peribacillus simplex TaxID=1478 RepID=A0AAN2TSR5_9BACI|nr:MULTISPECIES: AAA family ATPase [Bacillaceae]MCP1096673.1 AAA family ATPase [Bacillaceae bacterium OS4b]MCF7622481.1 AAA family ATPase [Peribacillus frigoritolerans]MCT1391989.1 AAA family ATPase [Peribacillus frigoritolerans]NCT38363.1 AAA family ATPase [Peribacillus frigoritolerans]PRA78425.1 ATP-binding protein [Peribacillus simplex]